jgi:sortase A
VLVGGSIAMFGWCAFDFGDSWLFQRNERRQFEQLLAGTHLSGTPSAVAPISLKPLPAAVTGDLIGRLEISRLGVSVIVIEGTNKATLRRAVGHIPGTALPGQPGNAGISGHRDTFFRPLRNIRHGDIVTITTPLREYHYRVVSTRIVSPREVAVLDPGDAESLTLVTCYPFYFVGSAPGRFIVRAERIQNSS